MSEEIQELKALRHKLEQAREKALQKNDTGSVAALDELLVQIEIALDLAALKQFDAFAKKLKGIQAEILKTTKKAKAWPFDQDGDEEEHEVQYKGPLQENDDEDEGPDSGTLPPKPIAPEVVPTPSAGWSDNYQQLWESMTIRPEWRTPVKKIATEIIANQNRYVAAVEGTKVPWWFIAVVHAMESGMKFTTHIHNGDSLSQRTVNVPIGHPALGTPPFTWAVSTREFLTYKKLDLITDWSLTNALFLWHRNNGINNEYKARHIPTPYLWSGSQHYLKGKYTADHKFDPEVVSKQPGAAVLLRALIDLKAVSESGQKLKANPVASTGSVAALSLKVSGESQHVSSELKYPGALQIGSSNLAAVKRLQEWLNLHGCSTPIDAGFGPSTAEQLGRFAIKNGRPDSAVLSEEIWTLLTAPMRRALAPIDYNEMSLEQAVVKIARQHIAQSPTEVGGSNMGPWVRIYMDGREGEIRDWTAGFACFIVAQASRDLEIPMPFERRDTVAALVTDAQNSGRFVPQDQVPTSIVRRSKIQPGSIFVVRNGDTSWTAAGIVAQINDETFDTFEGNTEVAGVAGPNATKGNRNFANKDFVRLL